MSYVKSLSITHVNKLLEKAVTEESRERLYLQYLFDRQYMTKENFVSFEAYYQKALKPVIKEEKSRSDILMESVMIERSQKNGI